MAIKKLKRRMNLKTEYNIYSQKYLKALELINKWERENQNIPSIVKYWKADCLIKTGRAEGVVILENILKRGRIKSNEMNILRLIAEEKRMEVSLGYRLEQYFKETYNRMSMDY